MIDEIGYCGIVNEGATCYINTLLQSLFFTNEFREIVYSIVVDKEDAEYSFVFRLKYIFYALQSGVLPKITTKKLIACFNWDGMTETNQQDIQEFLRLLMDKLLQYLDGSNLKNRLQDLFVGELKTTTKRSNGHQSTSQTEIFWDIQLPIDEDADIDSAFRTYLKSIPITGYQYDNDEKRDDAMQELEFKKLPPVLHIQLQRFKFNSKTCSLTKNNKKFEFHQKLDLSEYCDGAIYTLHSVLAHSGTANAGHYAAFISPNVDDDWYKFNDEIVTKCSSIDAIDQNYGNGSRRMNAYMLVYIKDTCCSDVLREVSLDNVISKELIEVEMSKETEEQLNRDRYFEIVVFTHDTLESCGKYKRGKLLFNRKCAMKDSFYIEKDKHFEDLVQLFVDSLHLSSENSFRFCDFQSYSEKLLKNMLNENIGYFFVELLSEGSATFAFEMNKHALIFIKQYNPISDILTYFGHCCFELNLTAGEINAYIRELNEFHGDERIELVLESGLDDDYSHSLLKSKDLISKFATKNVDTFSAMIVFEILENDNRKPKFLSLFDFGSQNIQPKPSQPIRRENTINVTINRDTSYGEELLSYDYQPELKLSELVEQLTDVYSQPGHLLDAENNIIDMEFLDLSILEYANQQNQQNVARPTRSQAKQIKSLTFSYKFHENVNEVERMDQSMSSTDIYSTRSMSAVPMEWETEKNYHSNPIEPIPMWDESPKNVPDVECTRDISSAADSFNTVSENSDNSIKVSRPSFHSTPKPKHDLICLLFRHRRDVEKEDVELVFIEDERFTEVLDLLCARLELKRHRLHAYYSNGDEITDTNITLAEISSKNESTRVYEENSAIRSSVIMYEENAVLSPYQNHSEVMSMKQISSKGLEIGTVQIPINERKTIGDICSDHKDVRVVELSSGIIRRIVPPDTKLVSLVGNGFDYRLDTVPNSFVYIAHNEAFNVCIRFINRSPEKRLNIPILVEVYDGMPIQTLGLIVCNATGEHGSTNITKNFKFEGDCIETSPDQTKTVVVKPNNPDTIPLITLDMGFVKGTRGTRLSYRFNIPKMN